MVFWWYEVNLGFDMVVGCNNGCIIDYIVFIVVIGVDDFVILFFV